MTALLLPLILGAGVTLAPSPVAPPVTAAPDTCTVAAELEVFAASLTGYPSTATCPEIQRMSFPEGAHSVQAAAYFPDSGVITLADDLDLGTIVGRSFLLHEIVHAMQFRDGRHETATCTAHLEAEAYAVQGAYLRMQDADASWANLMSGLMSGCPGDADY